MPVSDIEWLKLRVEELKKMIIELDTSISELKRVVEDLDDNLDYY